MLSRKKIYIKYIANICSLVFFLAACSAAEDSNIISSELVTDEEEFGKDTAQEGDFVETKTYEAKRVYPQSDVITSSYNGVYLSKIHVETGQEVKEGELLVSVQPVTEAALEKKEQEIAKSMEDISRTLQSYEQTIANLEQKMQTVQGTERNLVETQLTKTRKQYEWYKQDGEKTGQELKEELEQMKQLPEDLNLYAPYDGEIDKIDNVPAGTELTTDREIMTMHSSQQVLLEVSDGSSLSYGQKVTVETGSGERIKTYTGKVISADNIRPDGLKNGSASIQIDGSIPDEELTNVRIKANVKELYHVLVVKSYAIATEKDRQYVTVSDKDKVSKRRVITGGNCGEYTWILQGLEAGQSVMIQ